MLARTERNKTKISYRHCFKSEVFPLDKESSAARQKALNPASYYYYDTSYAAFVVIVTRIIKQLYSNMS